MSYAGPFILTEPMKQIPQQSNSMTREVMEAICSLEDICEAPKQAMIPLNLSFEATASGIENLVIMVRDLMGIGSAIVFDYIELFESMGFRVVFVPFPKEMESLSFFDMKNQNAFFFIRSNMKAERQFFQLMYQLWNIFFLSWAKRTGQSPFPEDGEAPGSNDPVPTGILTRDQAARYFATLFLMPEQSVLKLVSQLGIHSHRWTYELLLRIKHRFGVSAEAFLYRLRELSLIDPVIYDQLREKIMSHYAETNRSEPGSTRCILTSNGRIWDLLHIARSISGFTEDVMQIEQTFSIWKLE